MMFYVPIYALMAKISFLGLKKFNYTELLVIFTYIQAQLSIVSAIVTIITAMFGVSQGVFSIVAIPLMILYSAYCLKRLYELSAGKIILRTILFLFVLAIVFILISIVMGIIMYLNGDFDQMMEAKKAAQGG